MKLIKIDKLSGSPQDRRKWVDRAGICPPNISGNQESVNPFLPTNSTVFVVFANLAFAYPNYGSFRRPKSYQRNSLMDLFALLKARYGCYTIYVCYSKFTVSFLH